MEDPTPASCSTNTSCPWRASSWTPDGVMATRYSLFLISRGIPTFIRPTIVHQVRRSRAPYRDVMKWYADSSGRRTFGIVVDVVPIVVALLVWAFFRIRFVRRATAASRLVGSEGSMELFALRALTRQPLRRLAPLGPDLARRFRDGDPVLVRQLAALELTSCGVSVDGGETSPQVPRLA